MNIMIQKRILSILVLPICLLFDTNISRGDEDPYSDKEMQTVLRQAYSHVQACYPAGETCISDSVYSYTWDEFSDIVDSKTYEKMRQLYRKNNSGVQSKAIRKLFPKELCTDCKAKFIVRFSIPIDGLLKCYVTRIDREGIQRYAPDDMVFLFLYDDDGLFQINKRTMESEYEDYVPFNMETK